MKLDNKLWVLITVILSAGLLAGGWFVGVEPQLTAAGGAALQQITVDAQNAASKAQIAELEKAQDDLPELEAQLATLQASVPPGVNGSSFIASLNAMASQSGVSLTAFDLTAPTSYVSPGAAAAAAAAPQGDGAATTKGDEAPAEVAPAEPVGPVPTSNALITGENFVLVPISVEVKGTNDQVLTFLRALQYGPRLVAINQVQKTQEQDAAIYTLTASGYMYVLKNAAVEMTATEG